MRTVDRSLDYKILRLPTSIIHHIRRMPLGIAALDY